MGKTVFHDLYTVSRMLSTYLPLSGGLALDKATVFIPKADVVEGEHWVIVSKTGNGKTFFVKGLIRAHVRKMSWLNVYHLDTKKQGDFNSQDGQIITSFEPPPPLTKVGGKQVWQPSDVEYKAGYDKYFRQILDAGKPACVNIDESKNLKFGDSVPKGYELLLSQGRLPGIHTYTNVQEVAKSPRQAFSQPSHIVGFSVWNAYDANMMRNYLRIPGDLSLMDMLKGKRSFLYLNPDKMGEPRLFLNAQQFIQWFMSWDETWTPRKLSDKR
jgi:hypothetical protein